MTERFKDTFFSREDRYSLGIDRRWPDHSGFKDGVYSVADRIPVGKLFDRVGLVEDWTGDFMSTAGDSYPTRSLAPGSAGEYHLFEGTGVPLPPEWELRYGEAGPAFDQPGGSTQWVRSGDRMTLSTGDNISAFTGDAVHAFDRIRDIQRRAGVRAYDPAEQEGSRLYFRSRYREGIEQGWADWTSRGEWSGYAIDWGRGNGFEVVFTRKPERASSRAESVQAIFTRLEDAAKFIIANVGDSLRVDCGLQTLFLHWQEVGLDVRIGQTAPTDDDMQRMIEILPAGKEGLVREHLQKFGLRADPAAQSIGFPGVRPYMNVIPVTYKELENELLDGLQFQN